MGDKEQDDPFGRGGEQSNPFGESTPGQGSSDWAPPASSSEAQWGSPPASGGQAQSSWPGAPPVVGTGTGQGTPGKATASLVLGILGFIFCPVVCSVLAVVFGQQAKAEIDRNPGMTGRGQAQAGFILGVVGLVISVLFLLLIIIGLSAGDPKSGT
jgi:hypothetical protein